MSAILISVPKFHTTLFRQNSRTMMCFQMLNSLKHKTVWTLAGFTWLHSFAFMSHVVLEGELTGKHNHLQKNKWKKEPVLTRIKAIWLSYYPCGTASDAPDVVLSSNPALLSSWKHLRRQPSGQSTSSTLASQPHKQVITPRESCVTLQYKGKICCMTRNSLWLSPAFYFFQWGSGNAPYTFWDIQAFSVLMFPMLGIPQIQRR